MTKNTNPIIQSVRQGDVLLIAIDNIPATAKPVKPEKNRPPILAYGETSGHAHGLYGKATMYRDDGAGAGLTVGGEPITKFGFTGQFAEILATAAPINAPSAVLAHGTPIDAVTLPRDPDHSTIPATSLLGRKQLGIRQREFPRAAPSRQVAD